MKRIFKRALLVLLGLSFITTFAFLIAKSREEPVLYTSETPVTMDIVQKTVTSGSIVPKEVIEVKSRLSGIVGEIFVEPGDTVAAGDPIASIRVIPAGVDLNRAENELGRARILLDDAFEELERQNALRESNAISEIDYETARTEYRLALVDYETAENNLMLIREGVSTSGREANVISAPAGGMVLEIPVKVGSPVVESNSFNEGTSLAVLADMGRLIFEGHVDESEIGRVHVGMHMEVQIAAIEDETFRAQLDTIAPKGEDMQGTIQFRIEASIEIPHDHFIRAGYSANADIVLDRADQSTAIAEKNVLFEDGKTFVEVETGEQLYERREITLGLSDGIMVEVRSGLTVDEPIKVQQ